MSEDTGKLRPLGEATGYVLDEAHKLGPIGTEDPTVRTVNADTVPMRPPVSANNDDADMPMATAKPAAASTPVAPLLRYRIQEHKGQWYVGYFLPDPRKNMKLQLIAKTQHRSRPVADGHMVNRALTVCRKKNVYLLQMVYSNETGAFAFWDTEADALEGAKKSEQACVLYRPNGKWEAL